MNNVMHLVKSNLLKLVMALLIAVAFASSGVGYAQTKPTPTQIVVEKDSNTSDGPQMMKSGGGSGWGG